MIIKTHIVHCGKVGTNEATTRYEKTLHPAPYSEILRSKKCRSVSKVIANHDPK